MSAIEKGYRQASVQGLFPLPQCVTGNGEVP